MSGIYPRLNRLSRFCVWTFTPKSSILRRKTLPLSHQFELPSNVVQTQQRVFLNLNHVMLWLPQVQVNHRQLLRLF